MHPEYQYLNLLKEALDTGVRKIDRGTGVASYSLFGRQIRFDLSQGFPLLTTKKVYWKGVLYELFWFMKGSSNIKYLVDHNVHIWDDYPYKIYRIKSKVKSQRSKVEGQKSKIYSKEEFVEKIRTDDDFAEKWGELPRIYGELWRRWPTSHGGVIDQLAWAINEIVEDPNAHNAIVNSWNPEYLYTMARAQDTSYFPICHNMFQLNVIDGKVCLQLYQRSADLFLGVPFNIASYALLTHLIAHITGYKVGEFVHTFGDVHIYENHIDQVKKQLTRKPRQFSTLVIRGKAKNIDDLEPENVSIDGYNPYPPIKAELTVAGGYYSKNDKILNPNDK